MNFDPVTIVVAAAAALSVILLMAGIGGALSRGGDTIESRLDKYASRQGHASESARAAQSTTQMMAQIDKRIAKQGFATSLGQEIARANLKITVTEFFLLSGGATIVGALAGYLLTRELLVAVGAALVGLVLPRLILRQRKTARLHAFEDQLGDTITLMANSLRSGYSILQSMEMVSKEAGPPVSVEFARVVREIGLGLPQQEALDNLLRRIESADLDLTVTAINVQREVGGNLAKILDTIGHTIRERVRIKGEIRVLTSQQRLSMYIIIALPFFLSGVIYMINPAYMGKLFEPGPILCLPGCALFMIFIGYLVIRKIVNIDV
ncbi:MAG: type II secretion system F family protein [Chloroflexi bacterium]|nr:type II secretion system F family protein [Chloroflexota bacterium]MBU1751945.1 type II secretion system F family protein [Chloroflexota bacterium]MBU1878623.1 type II secretion system F family protein [Chloroflexota bacterium]